MQDLGIFLSISATAHTLNRYINRYKISSMFMKEIQNVNFEERKKAIKFDDKKHLILIPLLVLVVLTLVIPIINNFNDFKCCFGIVGNFKNW